MRYRIFPNLFISKPASDCVGVFHPLTLRTIFIRSGDSKAVFDFLGRTDLITSGQLKYHLRRTGTTFSVLRRERIIVSPRFDYHKTMKSFRNQVLRQEPRLHACYFIVSEECNLDCKYCFIESGLRFTHKKSLMSEDMALNAAVFFVSHVDRPSAPSVAFYGGEPLLNYAAVRIIAKVIRKLEIRVPEKLRTRMSMVTNGTLVTREMARFFAKYGVAVTVSLDGRKNMHDLQRVQAGSGAGSFRNALRGYRLLKRAGVNTQISCSIGSHNIDYLPQIAAYFGSELKPSFVGMNIMLSTDTRCSNGVDMHKLSPVLLKVYEILRNHGISEDHIDRRLTLDGFLKQHLTDCAGCGEQLVICPDGSFGPCHAFTPSRKYFFGNILDKPHDFCGHRIMRLWKSRLPLNIPDCLECSALLVCGGGCGAHVYAQKKTLFKNDERFCVFF